MEFVSLNAILGTIAARITMSESAKLAADEPAWLQNLNETYYCYSKAAALLDRHIVTTQHSSLPRWFDLRDGTGYPRPSDAARNDGMQFLLTQAKWYPQWLKFNKEFRMRTLNAIGRWSTPPSGDDYLRDCPPLPDMKFVNEIGFDAEDVVTFLDRLAVPHEQPKTEPQEPISMPAANGAVPEILLAATGNPGIQLSLSDEGTQTANEAIFPHLVHKTSTPGRRSLIEDALQAVYIAAGANRFDVDLVFKKLIELASARSKDFPPLCGYENGQVVYWMEGIKKAYTKKALAEYIRRRRQDEQNE